MKKRLFAAVFLLLCVFALPMHAVEAKAQETVSENAAAAYSYNKEFLETLDLMALDWRNCSDEAISHAVMMKDWYEIGIWLASMPESDCQELLGRNTDLHSVIPREGAKQEDYQTVYEYALEVYESMGDEVYASYPRNTSGYWTTNIVNGATGQTCSIKHKLTGFDKDVSTGKSQSLTLTPTISGVNWCGATCDSGSKSTYTLKGDSTYAVVPTHIAYNKPAGYTASVEYSHTSSMHQLYFDGTLYGAAYADTSTKELTDSTVRRIYPTNPNMTAYNASTYAATMKLISLVNVYRLAGVGCTGSSSYTGENLIQTITLVPINYNVNYNGNGATGGGVSAQNCAYGKTYTAQGNGFSRNYTVTYNGNGGTPAVASQTANYTFAGWGANTTAKVTHTAGAAYSNLTTTANATIHMHAIWNPASIKLTTATRTGYQFGKWNIGAAGAAYTPTGNVTAVASWIPNKYTIQLNEDEETIKILEATYDMAVSLPEPVRAGYTFRGWIGENGIYQGTAINLTAENQGVVKLLAQWEACGDTAYKVNRYKQTSPGADDYELFNQQAGDEISGTEWMYATTDSVVTVPALSVKGYETPDAQMVKISGDGSTVVNFYYKLSSDKSGDSYYVHNQIVQDGSLSAEKYVEIADDIAQKIIAGLSVDITIDEEVYRFVRKKDGTLSILSVSGKSEQVVVPEAITVDNKLYRITEICDKAFCGNAQIKQIVIPGSVTRIGKEAFSECKNLKQVVMEEGILEIGSKAFYHCTSLTVVEIPKTVLSIGSYAFAKCKLLKKVTFVSGAKLLEMGKSVFSGCSSLRSIKLPSKLTSIPEKAFYNCRKLKTAVIGKAVTKIGKKAFYNCRKLKKVTMKTRKLSAIGSKAFKKCAKQITFLVPPNKKGKYRALLKGKW